MATWVGELCCGATSVADATCSRWPLRTPSQQPGGTAALAAAPFFNTWLTHGVPTSEGFRHVVITPILKRLTEDPSNPQEVSVEWP